MLLQFALKTYENPLPHQVQKQTYDSTMLDKLGHVLILHMSFLPICQSSFHVDLEPFVKADEEIKCLPYRHNELNRLKTHNQLECSPKGHCTIPLSHAHSRLKVNPSNQYMPIVHFLLSSHDE